MFEQRRLSFGFPRVGIFRRPRRFLSPAALPLARTSCKVAGYLNLAREALSVCFDDGSVQTARYSSRSSVVLMALLYLPRFASVLCAADDVVRHGCAYHDMIRRYLTDLHGVGMKEGRWAECVVWLRLGEIADVHLVPGEISM